MLASCASSCLRLRRFEMTSNRLMPNYSNNVLASADLDLSGLPTYGASSMAAPPASRSRKRRYAWTRHCWWWPRAPRCGTADSGTALLSRRGDAAGAVAPGLGDPAYDLFSPHQDIISERLATLAALPGLKRASWWWPPHAHAAPGTARFRGRWHADAERWARASIPMRYVSSSAPPAMPQ